MLAIPIKSKGQPGPIIVMVFTLIRNGKLQVIAKKCLLSYLELPNGAYGCLNSRLDISAFRIHEQLLTLSLLLRRAFFLASTSHIDDYALSFSHLSVSNNVEKQSECTRRRRLNDRNKSVSLRDYLSRQHRDCHYFLRLTVTAWTVPTKTGTTYTASSYY